MEGRTLNDRDASHDTGSRSRQGVRFAFLVGTGRCGSSLVHELLARHPHVAFLSNLDDRLALPPAAGRWNNPAYRAVPQALTRKGRVRFAPSEGYRALEREVSAAVTSPIRDLTQSETTPWLQERFRSFFEQRAAAQDRPLFVHKFTGWPRLGLIHGAFPDAKIVHVVRDGRAVANSLLQTRWWQGISGPLAWGQGPLPDEFVREWEDADRSTVLLAGLYWKMLEDAALEALSTLDGELWTRVRYEDFVADPSARIRELCDFLGLPPSPELERALQRQQVSTQRRRAFEDDLSTDQLRLLEKSLSGHLDRLGY